MNIQHRTVFGLFDLHGHDPLVALHELIPHHLQMRPALGNDILFGADLQQLDVPVDQLQLALRGDHHFIVGVLDGLGFNLDVGYQISRYLF